MPLRVLISDRRSIVRDGLRTILEEEEDIEVVELADSGIQAITLVRRHLPDVVVTGLELDGMPGLELVRRLEREEVSEKPRVVVFAMTDSDEMITETLRAGANGLLVKDANRYELAEAVRAAARGHTMLAPAVTQRLVEWYLQQTPAPSSDLDAPVTSLTPRELEVLTLMAQGMSTEGVAKKLFIGIATVRTHIYRLRCKLDVKDRAQLVSYAYRSGIMQRA